MYCVECGTKVVDGAKFCPNCGNRIEKAKYTTQPGGNDSNGIEIVEFSVESAEGGMDIYWGLYDDRFYVSDGVAHIKIVNYYKETVYDKDIVVKKSFFGEYVDEDYEAVLCNIFIPYEEIKNGESCLGSVSMEFRNEELDLCFDEVSENCDFLPCSQDMGLAYNRIGKFFVEYDEDIDALELYSIFVDENNGMNVCCANAKIEIKNSNNEIVYGNEIFVTSEDYEIYESNGKKLLCCRIEIEFDDILDGTSDMGEVLLTFSNGAYSTDTVTEEISGLPVLIAPISVPQGRYKRKRWRSEEDAFCLEKFEVLGLERQNDKYVKMSYRIEGVMYNETSFVVTVLCYDAQGYSIEKTSISQEFAKNSKFRYSGHIFLPVETSKIDFD